MPRRLLRWLSCASVKGEILFGDSLVVALDGFVDRVVILENGDEPRHYEQRLDAVGDVRKTQVAPGISHRGQATNQHTKSARVHELDLREIDHHILLPLLSQLVKGLRSEERRVGKECR